MVHLLALQGVVRAIVHGPRVAVDQVHAAAPQEDFRRPVGVALVAGGAEEARAQLEEERVGDGGFVVVAVGAGGDFPFQAAAAGGRVPAGDHFAVDVLRDGQPGGPAGGEVVFGGGHGGKCPPALVVVAVGQGAEEVCACANVGEEGARDEGVVRGVAGVVPVVEETVQGATRFPPVVGGWKLPV